MFCQHETTFTVGEGKVNAFGYRVSKAEDATGIILYVMVKVSSVTFRMDRFAQSEFWHSQWGVN